MICLDLPMPPSVNVTKRAVKNRHSGNIYMVGGEEAVAYARAVQMIANGAPVAPVTSKARLKVEAWLTFPSLRWDIDGPVKCLLDALAQALGFNDMYIGELVLHKRVERGVRHCYVEVSEAGK